MKNRILIFTLLFSVVLLVGCTSGIIDQEEKERVSQSLIENEKFGQYIEHVDMFEDIDGFDKELGIFPYNLFINTNEGFYKLTQEQKHFVLKETSEFVFNNIPSDVKTENGHIKCSGENPCRFIQISYSYDEGDYDDEEAISEYYFIDFIEQSDDFSVMTIFRKNEEFRNQHEEITDVQEMY